MSLSTREKVRMLKWMASIGTVILLLWIGFENYPQLLGAWESFTFYKTFGTLDPGLSFRISPRANIAYEGYALLEIGRYVTDLIGWGFISFRLPVILYGLISLAIFFICARRWFGYWPALGATVLMGLNPVFLVYQHQMTVVMVTFMLLLFVFERLQNLEANPQKYISWVTLGIASAFCALHYGPGRHLMIYLIGLFSAMLLIFDPYVDRIDRPVLRSRFSGLMLFIVSFLGCLMVMNPLNLWDILHFKSYVFPAGSEGSLSWPEIKKSIAFNFPVILESLTGRRGANYHSAFITDIIIDSRYPVLPLVMVLPCMMGLLLCLMRPRDKRYFVIHFFLLAVIVPMTFSTIIFNPDEDEIARSTLSNHRLFFVLIPIYLYIAAGIHRVTETPFFESRTFIRWALAGLVLFCFGVQMTSVEGEKKRFNNLTQTVIAKPGELPLSNQIVLSLVKESRSVLDRPVKIYQYYADQLQYLPVVNHIAKDVKDWFDKNSKTQVLVVPVALNNFNSNTVMHYYRELNFHSVYLSFYLSDLGINTGFIQVLSPELERSWFLDGARWLFGGPVGRQFSASMEIVENQLEYIKPSPRFPKDASKGNDRSFWKRFRGFVKDYPRISSDKLGYELRQTQRKFPEVIITTTRDELEAAKSILNNMRKNFRVLQPV